MPVFDVKGPSKWMTETEACEVIGCSPGTLLHPALTRIVSVWTGERLFLRTEIQNLREHMNAELLRNVER